jgi:hypothetical protein
MLILLLIPSPLPAQRVGFHQDFSAATEWQTSTWPGVTGMASIAANGQETAFTTLVGTFMTGASAAWAPTWPDWDKDAPPGLAIILRKYPGTVDLDRYHFLAVRTVRSGTYMALGVNGWDTKVCYTPGLHAVDLRDLQRPSLRGQQAIEIKLTFLNTGGSVALDDLKLVESLTPEEQAGFIPAGLDLRLEKRDPLPYHGLEALNARAGCPVRFDLPEEKAVFRDTSTGAVVWKLNRSIRNEHCDRFNGDGSVIPVYGRSFKGMTLYDFAAGGLREFPDLRGAAVFNRATPGTMYLLQSSEAGGKAHYLVQSVDVRSGTVTAVAEWDSEDSGGAEFGASPYSGRLILGLKEGRALYLIDPAEPLAQKRVRRVPLPMRMKGSSFSHDDARVNWQRCYYFQPWQMDLATGEVSLAHYPTYGGHEIFGQGVVVGRYVSMMLAHDLGTLPCDEATAGEVRIWSNWLHDVPSDYGQLSDDNRWLVTNGTDGAVAGKRLLVDGQETGTVLQIVHDFTSRNSWDSNTYSRISPDATKLAYNCDLFGDTDVYVAITRRPEAPRNLTLTQDGTQVTLRWEPPAAACEVAGYTLYRSAESGRNYRRVNRERIGGTATGDTPPPGPVFYAVAAEEHSGIEGLYSAEVHVGDAAGHRLYLDVEEADLTPPFRHRFDGDCSNYRCARVWKESPAEAVGEARVRLTVPADGAYRLWLRARGRGSVECQVAGATAAARIETDGWAWLQAGEPVPLRADSAELVLRSADDGLCLDLALLTSVADDRPAGIDGRDASPGPVTGLRAVEASADQVRLAWDPSSDPGFDQFSVYVGDQPEFVPGNATLLASGKGTEALDWGFAPGSVLFYKVLAFNKRGLASTPATARVEVPARRTVTIALGIAQAALSGGLERGEAKGVAFAHLPVPLAAEGPHPRATWQVQVPADGIYYVWARYTTFDAKRVSLFWVECDGEAPIKGSNWRLRFPNTLTRHQGGVTPGEETWFCDKLLSGYWAGPADALRLGPGEHTLAVGFESTHAPNGPRLSAVFLSSDPSYRPPGFVPRVDFRK